MARIPVNSFGVDMNALLNQLNNKNGLERANIALKQAWKATQKQYDTATQNLNTAIHNYKTDMTDYKNTNTKFVNTNIDFVKGQIVDTKNGLNYKLENAKDLLNSNINDAKGILEKNRKESEDQILKKIESSATNIKQFVNGQKYITPSGLDNYYNNLWGHITYNGHTVNGPKDMAKAVFAQDGYIADQMAQQSKANQAFVNQEINSTLSGSVQKDFANMKDQLPHNFMKFVHPGDPMPAGTPGDICWVSSDFNQFSNNAKAYMCTNSNGWQPLKTQLDLYASNIYSPNIQGGVITGEEFLGANHGRDGQSRFSVDEQGDIYAHNLYMDLDTCTIGTDNRGHGVNAYTYNANNDQAKGLNFDNGHMTMIAEATQNSGTFVKGYNGAIPGTNNDDFNGVFNAFTYLQPNYLKLRSGTLGGSLLARTDLRGGNLELADQWGQNWGARLGYWNESSSNNSIGDVGPLLSFENGIKLGYEKNYGKLDIDGWRLFESSHDSNNANGTHFKNGQLIVHPTTWGTSRVTVDSPLDIRGTVYVDGKPVIKDGNFKQETNIYNEGSDKQQGELDRHDKWLQNHAQILQTPGAVQTDQYGHTVQSTRLDTHDSKIQDLYDKLQNKLSMYNSGGETVVDIEDSTQFVIGNSMLCTDGEIDCDHMFMDGVMISISGTRNTIDVDDTTLATYDWVKDNFKRSSRLSVKRDIHDVSSKQALAEVLNTDIKGWNYKKDSPKEKIHYGPIIDDINDTTHQKYYTPQSLLTDDKDEGIDIADSVSFLFLSVQELEKQNSQLSQRLAKLEFNNRK